MTKQPSPRLEAEYRKWKAIRAVERKAWKAVEKAKGDESERLWEKAEGHMFRRWALERKLYGVPAKSLADVKLKLDVTHANYDANSHFASHYTFWRGYRAVLKDIRRLAKRAA